MGSNPIGLNRLIEYHKKKNDYKLMVDCLFTI